MMKVQIPSGVTVSVSGETITVKGSLGENKRAFNSALLKVSVEGAEVAIMPTQEKALQKKAALSEVSVAKEISNDIRGVTAYFEIKMQSIHAHFPLTTEVKGSELLLKNMIGERAARVAKIAGGTKIEIKGQNLRLYGTKLDDVTQTAANIRKASKIRKKDERIFQDGIYYALEE